jgi:hypothetical protein
MPTRSRSSKGRGRTRKKDEEGTVVMSLAELNALRIGAELGELDILDPEVEEDLFMATMEAAAQASKRANTWDEEAVDASKAQLEAASGRSAKGKQGKGKQGGRQRTVTVDNTEILHQVAAKANERQLQLRSVEVEEIIEQYVPAVHERMATSVYFIGKTIDQLRKWIDECYARGCVQHTKASRIRLLAAHGFPTARIAKVLQTSYQQAYQTARYHKADAIDLAEEEMCPTCRKAKH